VIFKIFSYKIIQYSTILCAFQIIKQFCNYFKNLLLFYTFKSSLPAVAKNERNQCKQLLWLVFELFTAYPFANPTHSFRITDV